MPYDEAAGDSRQPTATGGGAGGVASTSAGQQPRVAEEQTSERLGRAPPRGSVHPSSSDNPAGTPARGGRMSLSNRLLGPELALGSERGERGVVYVCRWKWVLGPERDEPPQ